LGLFDCNLNSFRMVFCFGLTVSIVLVAVIVIGVLLRTRFTANMVWILVKLCQNFDCCELYFMNFLVTRVILFFILGFCFTEREVAC